MRSGTFGYCFDVENEGEERLKNTSSFLAWVMFNCDREKEEKVSKGS